MHSRFALLFLALVTALSASPPPAQSGPSADEALARLRDGNARYRAGAPVHPNQDAVRRDETAKQGQKPFAIVLSCADSRVPPEVVFDQGLGDLFVLRVAGNVAGVDETATVEYGAEHLGAPLCVVMGHTGCGAVKAVVDGAQLDGNLAELLGEIGPAVERIRKAQPGLAGNPLFAAAVEANVWLSIENLFHRSGVVRSLVGKGQLRVVGAVYDLATGEVRWLGPHPGQARLLAPGPSGSLHD